MSNCISLCHVLLHIFFLDPVRGIQFWKLQELLVSIKEWDRRSSSVPVLTPRGASHDTNHDVYKRPVIF